MGSFSWLFADTNNTKNLRADRKGYVACPDGTFICEPCYETYGVFDGKDIYDLVVEWNRKFIAENPDHLLPHVHYWTKVSAMRNYLPANGTLNRDSVSTVLRGISNGWAA